MNELRTGMARLPDGWMVIARNSKHIGVYNDIAYLSVSISESDVSLLKTSHEKSHEYQLVQNKS